MKPKPSARKTAQSQLNATKAYYAKALENINVILSQHDYPPAILST
ncbi:MAG: hypothetical protein Q4B71_00275 [Cardiobacteriaceae bacterium]|nr:hypothetical protein [Cardiobacteriaceae bacterium]